ncbi:MAG: RNA polymerase sigma factor [Desulfobacula sp.]|uniref:RNA polymerase sigma factor n=1 Tax=Desulfobacula sp. TaxID=2593537 RepID=UPI0025BC5C19|nr:RNA polymerase sigma factor [Desulfobacula sp.]MCD4721069.1 RNA polymerase sigma factor [Desulfobacula sp.]
MQKKNESASGGTHKADPLVLKAAKGDRAAFHRLVNQYRGSVYRMVYYRIRSKVDAEDLTQDVFFTAYRNLSGLKDPRWFKSWLYRIALNRVRDFVRKKMFLGFFRNYDNLDNVIEDHSDRHTLPEAEITMERKVFWETIEIILAKMSKMEREVFMLRFFDQMGIAVIAQTLKKGESTVKTHLYRAIEKFRKNPVAIKLMEEMIL